MLDSLIYEKSGNFNFNNSLIICYKVPYANHVELSHLYICLLNLTSLMFSNRIITTPYKKANKSIAKQI